MHWPSTIPYCFGDTVFETYHVVLPVTHMVADFLTKDRVPLVVGIEVHVECINVARAAVIDNDCTACRAIRLTIAVWFHTIKPRRIFSDVVDRG